MNPQDINNMSSWLQEILRLLQDTQTQVTDMRNESKQMMDDLKGVTARMDQKDSDIIRLIDSLRSQLDVIKGETTATKGAVEKGVGDVESKVSDAKSDIRSAIMLLRSIKNS